MTFKKVLAVFIGGALMILASSIKTDVYAGEYLGDQTLYNDLSYDNTDIMETARWANGGVFGCVFSKENVSFKDGIMSLKIDKNTNSKYNYDYSGAEYRTKGTYKYGMYTVRMKPIKNDGVVSSFFTYTGPSNGTIWDEIDIEFLGKDTTKVQFNFFADGEGDHEYIYDLGFDASEEWHEYGFLWEEDAITWYVDGVAVHKVTSANFTLPKTESQIMMNVWNGRTDMSNIRAWLNEYDGTIGLTAEYDYFSYIPVSEYDASDDIPSESEQPEVPSESETEEEIEDDGNLEPEKPEIYFPAYEKGIIKNLDKKEWKDVAGQYDMSVKTDGLRITRNADKNQENVYIEGELDETIYNPKKINMNLNYTNGYKLSISVYVVDENGHSYFVQNVTYDKKQKGHITVDMPIDADYGNIKSIRLYVNSDSRYIDVINHAYCRFFIHDFSISN